MSDNLEFEIIKWWFEYSHRGHLDAKTSISHSSNRPEAPKGITYEEFRSENDNGTDLEPLKWLSVKFEDPNKETAFCRTLSLSHHGVPVHERTSLTQLVGGHATLLYSLLPKAPDHRSGLAIPDLAEIIATASSWANSELPKRSMESQATSKGGSFALGQILPSGVQFGNIYQQVEATQSFRAMGKDVPITSNDSFFGVSVNTMMPIDVRCLAIEDLSDNQIDAINTFNHTCLIRLEDFMSQKKDISDQTRAALSGWIAEHVARQILHNMKGKKQKAVPVSLYS